MNTIIVSSTTVDHDTVRPVDAPAASDANVRSALADTLPAMPRIPSRKFYRQ